MYLVTAMGTKRSILLWVGTFLLGYAAAQPSLAQVHAWAYQLQNFNVTNIAADNSFELVVTDYALDGTGNTTLTPADVAAIKSSNKLYVSYLSIGEAEDYRAYWQASWSNNPPGWLGAENPNWAGNYKVKYWDAAWQSIIFDYIDTIIAQGFNGAYLDIIDGWYYWKHEVPAGQQVPGADSLMIDFVLKIRAHVNAVTGDNNFILIPQNGEDLVFESTILPAQRNAYFNAINAVGIEDVFFTGNANEDNPFAPDVYRLANLQQYQQRGIAVFNIEYLTQPVTIAAYVDTAHAHGFVPYACTRPLNQLCPGLTTGLAGGKWDKALNIYPNPANGDYVFIDNLPPNCTSIPVYDLAGSMIGKLPITGLKVLQVTSLANGIYFLKTGNDVTAPLKKLVVTK